ncbi:DNA starvation/stationary phase protection protein [Inquilinus sp. CAU 1745]|uniref:Dps family protein n=1 Tax=Inquilinus sp. CAU 1745 TaxID=3140369 RepID=UPI00325B3707
MNNDLDLSESEREIAAAGLAKLLAETFTLYAKTHGYYWNVEGPMFRTYHLLFEEQYRELWAAVDKIAERIRALGAYAPSAPADIAALSDVAPDQTVPNPADMVRSLIADHERVIRTMRCIRPAIDDIGDNASASLLDDRLTAHEKAVWMVRSLARDVGEGSLRAEPIGEHFAKRLANFEMPKASRT